MWLKSLFRLLSIKKEQVIRESLDGQSKNSEQEWKTWTNATMSVQSNYHRFKKSTKLKRM
jgi:hypothetical protein